MRHLLCALVGTTLFGTALAQGSAVRAVTVEQIPAEARATLRLIDNGGPFPHRRDGIVFQNRERRLPSQPKGYYREYTVPTPGNTDRGARRVITGGKPPLVFYYTADHYKTFNRVER